VRIPRQIREQPVNGGIVITHKLTTGIGVTRAHSIDQPPLTHYAFQLTIRPFRRTLSAERWRVRANLGFRGFVCQAAKRTMRLMMRLLLFLIVISLSAVAPLQLHAADKQPNIVFILVDDLRYDDLGCNGHPFSKTPNVDRLAAEGLNFTNAFATTPLCSPSRASFLTGLHMYRHGIIDNTDRSVASHKLDTFPIRLHDAGYKTAYVGKWHMGNDDSPRPGFDRWACMKGQGDSNDAGFNVDGQQVKTTGYVTDAVTKYSVDFIRENKAADGPLFLYVSHKALHPQTQQGPDGKLSDPSADNFIPADRHKALYEKDELPRRANYAKPPVGKPALLQSIEGLKPLGPETVSSDSSIRNRLRMLAAVDESTGSIIDALRETGRLDDTLIIFTGDHGYFYGEHGLSTERRLAYEEAIRIPLVMRYPKIKNTPRKVENTVLSLDIAPTVLQLGRGVMPAKLHGLSLVPLLENKGEFPATRDVLIQYHTDTVFPRVRNMGYAAIRTDRWKYIHYKELTDADELYDLHSDPYEMANLISDPKAAETLADMKKRLAKAVAEAQ
jgi:arylsulfatase A-like enzyme